MTKKMAKKPNRRPPAASATRVLVQALVEPEVRDWLIELAKERGLQMGPFLRMWLCELKKQTPVGR
jgi:hypothetical protein